MYYLALNENFFIESAALFFQIYFLIVISYNFKFYLNFACFLEIYS